MSTAELLREVEARRALPPPEMRRAIRVGAGVSQRKVADALGVSDATVLRWERGSHRPTGAHLSAYLELIDMLRGVS